MTDQVLKNVINGELVDAASGETYDVFDPATGAVYAQAPMSGAEDIDRAYAAADKAFDAWTDDLFARETRETFADKITFTEKVPAAQ